MKKIPHNLSPYKKTKIFDQDSVPKALLNAHSTKEGSWAKICIIEGRLLYSVIDSGEEVILTPSKFGVSAPKEDHKVTIIEDVKFYIEFYK